MQALQLMNYYYSVELACKYCVRTLTMY